MFLSRRSTTFDPEVDADVARRRDKYVFSTKFGDSGCGRDRGGAFAQEWFDITAEKILTGLLFDVVCDRAGVFAKERVAGSALRCRMHTLAVRKC
jgi:hypothetical protein